MGKKVVNMMDGVSSKDAWLWAIEMYRNAIEANLAAADLRSDDDDVCERIAAAGKALDSFADEMKRLVEGVL